MVSSEDQKERRSFEKPLNSDRPPNLRRIKSFRLSDETIAYLIHVQDRIEIWADMVGGFRHFKGNAPCVRILNPYE
jgi:hypothetical protein